VCFDPSGAEFDVWEPKHGQGTDADTTQHGVPSWFELRTTDPDRGASFYTRLFGWTAGIKPMPGMQYTLFGNSGVNIAGMVQITPNMGPMSPHWATFFTVADVEATARDTAKLGGKVVMPPTDVPDVGRFAAIQSPQGVPFLVIQYKR
jgi:predicted enzyme related to lactoylglutathione lyase